MAKKTNSTANDLLNLTAGILSWAYRYFANGSFLYRTYPKNMGVAEIEQFCWLARKKNGSIFKDILPFF